MIAVENLRRLQIKDGTDQFVDAQFGQIEEGDTVRFLARDGEVEVQPNGETEIIAVDQPFFRYGDATTTKPTHQTIDSDKYSDITGLYEAIRKIDDFRHLLSTECSPTFMVIASSDVDGNLLEQKYLPSNTCCYRFGGVRFEVLTAQQVL